MPTADEYSNPDGQAWPKRQPSSTDLRERPACPMAPGCGFGTKEPGLRLLTTKADYNRSRREPTLADTLGLQAQVSDDGRQSGRYLQAGDHVTVDQVWTKPRTDSPRAE
jgi:hypothetical protein